MNHVTALQTAKEVFEDIANKSEDGFRVVKGHRKYINQRAKAAARSIGELLSKESG